MNSVFDQLLDGTAGRGNDMVRQTRRHLLDQGSNRAERTEILMPVPRPPEFMTGNDEGNAAQLRDEPDRKDRKVGVLIGVDEVEPVEREP